MINLNKEITATPLPPLFDDPLKDFRAAGLKRYSLSGLPGKKVEHWMKFDITPLKEISYTQAVKVEKPLNRNANSFDEICDRVEMLNGFIDTTTVGKGYSLSSVSTEKGREKIAGLIGTAGDERGNYFYNLNSSLFSDPLLISVGPEQSGKPLYLSERISGEDESLIANPRIIIEVQENSSLELIQSFSGSSGSPYLNNSVTEIILGKNAKLEHVILLEDSHKAFVFNNIFVKQSEGSVYNSQTLISGASISRNEYDITLGEENCETSLSSLFLGKENQLHNSDITIHHDAPHCTSRTTTKAIAGGNSQGVFRGFALVKKGAQKSDAVQQFKSLLLNDTCQVNMEPHLEIWADDVKCSHGATVGQLDPNQLFYLQQRGFSPEEAKKVLMEAFAADVAESIGIDLVSDIIKTRIYRLMDDLYE